MLKKKQVKSIGTRLSDKRYIRYSSVYNVYSNVVFYIKFAEVIIIVNHLDLFSGVGGFSLALKRAIGKDKVGWVGYSDIDKHANKVFKRRFPDAEGLGSVTDIQPENLPERIDLVTFGSPCQDFSIAGKRGGISANRSSLFFEAMRIIRAKKPKYFVFENVKGLFSLESPKTERGYTLLDILEDSPDQKYSLSENQVKSLTSGMQKSRILSNTLDTQGETTEE